LKIYSEEESERRISWTHQIFGNVGDLDGKILGASETLVYEVYTGCLCIGCVYIEGIRGLSMYRVCMYTASCVQGEYMLVKP
jgi:hypothetical protein